MSKLIPLYDKIIVEKIEHEENRTASGLYLSEPDTEKCLKGKVVAIGHGKLTTSGFMVPLQVNEGDTILFSPHVGVLLEDDLLLLREEEVLCVILK